jgi:hypothetical protein
MLRRHFLKAAASVGTGLALFSNLGAAKANIQKPSSSPLVGSGQPATECHQTGRRQFTKAEADAIGRAVAQYSSDNIRADQEVRFLLKRIYGSARKL